jgi:hypothetical protein
MQQETATFTDEVLLLQELLSCCALDQRNMESGKIMQNNGYNKVSLL